MIIGREVFDEMSDAVDEVLNEADSIGIETVDRIVKSLISDVDVDDLSQFQQGALIAITARRAVSVIFSGLTPTALDAMGIYIAQRIHWKATS